MWCKYEGARRDSLDLQKCYALFLQCSVITDCGTVAFDLNLGRYSQLKFNALTRQAYHISMMFGAKASVLCIVPSPLASHLASGPWLWFLEEIQR